MERIIIVYSNTPYTYTNILDEDLEIDKRDLVLGRKLGDVKFEVITYTHSPGCQFQGDMKGVTVT